MKIETQRDANEMLYSAAVGNPFGDTHTKVDGIDVTIVSTVASLDWNNKTVLVNVNMAYECYPRNQRNKVRRKVLSTGEEIVYINNVNFRTDKTVYIFGDKEWSSVLYK